MSDFDEKIILVIDDDANIRRFIRKSIEKYIDNANVFEAEDGIEGMEKYRKVQPHITLFDLSMPKANGMEFLEAVAPHKKTGEAFIAITGEAEDPKLIAQLYKNGIDIFLRKGFYSEELAGIVTAHLDKINLINFQKLRSEEFDLLLNNSPDGYILFDPEMWPIFWNRKIASLGNGILAKELYKSQIFDESYIEIDHRAHIMGMIEKAQKEHKKQTREFKLEDLPDIGLRYLRIEILPITDKYDSIIHYAMILMDMTESFSLRDQLRENIRILDKIAQTLPTMIYLYDIDQKKKSLLNPESFKRWGIDLKEDNIDNWIITRVHPDDRERVYNHYVNIHNWPGEQTQFLECRFQKDNGEYIWVKVTDVPFGVRADGRCKQLVGSIENIHQYKTLINQLNTSNEDLNLILSTIDDAIWSVDKDMKMRYYNEGLANLWSEMFPDFPSVHDANKNEKLIRPTKQLEFFDDLQKKVIKNGEKISFHLKSELLPGRHYNVQLLPIKVSGEIEGTVTMMKDITEIISAQQQIQEGKERLELATQTSNVGVFEWNIKTNSIIWNESMYTIYDENPDDFTPTYRAWLKRIHPEDRDYILDLRRKTSAVDVDKYEFFRIFTSKGELKYIQPSARLFTDENGEAIKLIGVNIDITQAKVQEEELNTHRNYLSRLVDERTLELQEEINLRKIAEQELEKSLDRQVDFNQQKNKFVQMISHEFRTPLTQIMMSIDLLEMLFSRLGRTEISNKSDKYVSIIKTGVDEMTDILTITGKFFSLQEQLVYPLVYEFDFRNLISKLSSNILNAKSLPVNLIRIECATENTWIESAEEILYQAFYQILDNAIKYSGGQSPIYIRIDKSAQGLKVEITDSGSGILPKDLPFVTELFRRGEDQANVGGQRGLGIGLSIAKLSFDSLKCKMNIKSDYGNGTTVTVHINSGPDIFRNKRKLELSEN